MATRELEAALTRLGLAAAASRARYYLGLAYWKLGRLDAARGHLAGFLERLEDRDRQSLVAVEANRALAAIYAAQGDGARATELGQRAEMILREIEK